MSRLRLDRHGKHCSCQSRVLAGRYRKDIPYHHYFGHHHRRSEFLQPAAADLMTGLSEFLELMETLGPRVPGRVPGGFVLGNGFGLPSIGPGITEPPEPGCPLRRTGNSFDIPAPSVGIEEFSCREPVFSAADGNDHASWPKEVSTKKAVCSCMTC